MGKSALHVLAKRSQPDFGLRDKEREKRKKILKMCVQKLRDIDDPETVLCRAVLINNTFKSLKYAYRRVFRAQEPEPVPAPVYIQHQHQQSEDSDNDTEEEEEQEDSVSSDESSNSEDESGHASSSDNDQDSDADSDTVPSLDTDHGPGPDPAAFCPDELDTFTDPGCDMTNFSAESIVHSLMMPPLLSPQIEDMTNCSFYDSFASDAGVPSLEPGHGALHGLGGRAGLVQAGGGARHHDGLRHGPGPRPPRLLGLLLLLDPGPRLLPGGGLPPHLRPERHGQPQLL